MKLLRLKLLNRFKIRQLFIPLAIIILVLIASRDLIKPGYFSIHDDLQVGRLYQMELCFRDLQIPCRWVPDMGYGYGYPLYNFYPSLPYYFGMIFYFIGSMLLIYEIATRSIFFLWTLLKNWKIYKSIFTLF